METDSIITTCSAHIIQCYDNDDAEDPSIITCSVESKYLNPSFVRFEDNTYNNTQTYVAAPPKQNTFNTSSSYDYTHQIPQKGGGRHIKKYIDPSESSTFHRFPHFCPEIKFFSITPGGEINFPVAAFPVG